MGMEELVMENNRNKRDIKTLKNQVFHLQEEVKKLQNQIDNFFHPIQTGHEKFKR